MVVRETEQVYLKIHEGLETQKLDFRQTFVTSSGKALFKRNWSRKKNLKNYDFKKEGDKKNYANSKSPYKKIRDLKEVAVSQNHWMAPSYNERDLAVK